MRSKKTLISSIAVIGILVIGYFSFFHHPAKTDTHVVTVGIMTGSKDEDAIWDSVKKQAKDKYGITIKTKSFSDFSQPNAALSNGDIDLNAFQHHPFLDDWNKKHGTNLVSLGDTWTTPLKVYSSKVHPITNLNDLADGAQIVIPNDVTNQDRALHLLADAGVIHVKDTPTATTKDITSNPKNLVFTPVDASQTPKSLNDDKVAAAVVNTVYAKPAGIDLNSALYTEKRNKDTAPYNNLIAVDKKNANNDDYKKVVQAFQTDETKKVIDSHYHGAQIAVW